MGICAAGQAGKRSAGRRRQIWLGRWHQKTRDLGRGLGLTRHAPSREPVTRPNGKPRTGDVSNANWANFLRQELEGVQLFRHSVRQEGWLMAAWNSL